MSPPDPLLGRPTTRPRVGTTPHHSIVGFIGGPSRCLIVREIDFLAGHIFECFPHVFFYSTHVHFCKFFSLINCQKNRLFGAGDVLGRSTQITDSIPSEGFVFPMTYPGKLSPPRSCQGGCGKLSGGVPCRRCHTPKLSGVCVGPSFSSANPRGGEH